MIGTGYVGLVTGTCLAEVGHDVACVDLDETKIAQLREGKSPIFEPGLEGMIKRNLSHERLSFSSNLSEALKGAHVAFIAVGTPEGEDGSADLQHVKGVASSIGSLVNQDMMVIVKSTVPVGTCDMVDGIVKEELHKRGVTHHCPVASNPEFLKEGDAVKDFLKPDRIVVGITGGVEDEKLLRSLYKPFIMDDPSRLLVMDRRSSELTKYGANSMLATRISFMNELSLLCEKLGANIDKVRQGIGTDPRIGRKFLYAGPGYGGSCFPKDVSALLKTGEQNEVPLSVLSSVMSANQQQKERVSDKVLNYYKDLNGKRIAVWGLAFKPGTDDVREAPAMTIIEKLLKAGASVVAHDPQGVSNFKRDFGERENLTYSDSAYGALSGVDGMVLVTEWSEYKRPNWKKVAKMMNKKVVFDLRNQFEAADLISLGYHYEAVGRPDSLYSSSPNNS